MFCETFVRGHAIASFCRVSRIGHVTGEFRIYYRRIHKRILEKVLTIRAQIVIIIKRS